MFDPVWIGNYIVPRWEAFAIAGGSIIAACALAIGLIFGGCWIALKVGRRHSKMW